MTPGRQVRPEHLDHGDRAVAELGVETAYDIWCEQFELGRPRGRVGAYDQSSLFKRLRSHVGSDLVADESPQRPKTEWTLRSTSQPSWRPESAEQVVEGLGVAFVGARAAELTSEAYDPLSGGLVSRWSGDRPPWPGSG